ncbi:hypothetical protein DMB66_49555 [Actinoplanes sp. ATCC 53533]|uniref:helix-turn-helix transcriptional regulator n=1 Tax=Actinoplanes sp. ATCC 53533 TaxID=1288362 RepID=UPI000F7936F9|nr:LuxR family transcriptional regulator [Actinoplanes sp. ATCC 53533]RSM46478.1 hypothetical protein DMB66_49555 [Actinoplanes sp. ATCC 53533]
MSGSPALIGRDREVRQFTTLLDTVAPGRPAVLVVAGPHGSGRSRLLAEFAAAARRTGMTVLPGPEWIAAAGACLAGAPAGGPGPRLFLCDHPQRLDPRGWTAIELLAASHPVLVVVTARGGVDPVAAGHLTAPDVHRIRLAPLSPGEVERLVTLLLAGRPSAELLSLTGVAAGRPGAVLDLITGLLQEGLVRVVAGRAVLATVRLPARTRSRLGSQLAALSPQARHLLQAATTLRSPFRLVRLTRLLGVSPVALVPAIDEVLESGLLTGDNDVLMVSHELIRPVVEASMPRSVVAALREERPVRRVPAPRERQPTRTLPAVRRVGDWSLLTEREREIAGLAGRALTNRQIASRLGRSPHTVNYHLRLIYQKLAISSRVELAAMVRQQEPAGAPELPAAGPS